MEKFKVLAVETKKEVHFTTAFEASAKSIARHYNDEYGVTAFVINERGEVVFKVGGAC